MARTKQQQPESNPSLSIKAITKSSVWDIQENDVFRMWDAATKDAEVRENIQHYVDIFKSAFLIEEIKEDVLLVKKSYEKRGYKVAQIKFDDNLKFNWAIKKRPIMRVTDLTYENIRHISAAKLCEVLDHPFRISSSAALTSPPLPFPKTVCTRRAACMRRKSRMASRCSR